MAFMKNLLAILIGILQNDFHLKSSFDKTKCILDQSIWECNFHLFSNTKAFCVVYKIYAKRNSIRFIF